MPRSDALEEAGAQMTADFFFSLNAAPYEDNVLLLHTR